MKIQASSDKVLWQRAKVKPLTASHVQPQSFPVPSGNRFRPAISGNSGRQSFTRARGQPFRARGRGRGRLFSPRL